MLFVKIMAILTMLGGAFFSILSTDFFKRKKYLTSLVTLLTGLSIMYESLNYILAIK